MQILIALVACLCERRIYQCQSFVLYGKLIYKAQLSKVASTSVYMSGMSNREMEIRRKIQSLKKQGLIKKIQGGNIFDGMDADIDEYDDANVSDYTERIRKKLGPTKSKLLGYGGKTDENPIPDSDSAITKTIDQLSVIEPRIGFLDSNTTAGTNEKGTDQVWKQSDSQTDDRSTPEEDDNDGCGSDIDDRDLVDLVAQKLQEKRDREQKEMLDKLQEDARKRLEQLENDRIMQSASNSTRLQLTSGVGGSWSKDSVENAAQDVYKPKSGSWGVFERPKDISRAYGGGRRVGPGFSNEAERLKSEQETRDRLKNYRVKMGIDVETEKNNEVEINEALHIASLAMQRGMYSTAVSALEKVTKYCSTNSEVGGKVFLELAMAYEAVGRTKEAIKVYSTLSHSRIEKIKINAKRLLYGIEAMQFMQENVNSVEYSRKRASSTFIDTTGLANIASKFEDRYETAYIDLSNKSNFYKRLTESVIRSPREARQVLLTATAPGQVERLRIVQALRSLSRHFDEALDVEIQQNSPQPETGAVMNGKPILPEQQTLQMRQNTKGGYGDTLIDDESEMFMEMDEYMLGDAVSMKRNLAGEWRLQLLADKRGDGVRYFDSSVAWQNIDIDTMSFNAISPSAFLSVQLSGNILFNEKRRVLRRSRMETSGSDVGAMLLSGLFGGQRLAKTSGGAIGAISTPQQVVLVDSVLLMTRNVPSKLKRNNADEKDFFAVWRRVDPGTYSSRTPR